MRTRVTYQKPELGMARTMTRAAAAGALVAGGPVIAAVMLIVTLGGHR
ncbi:hypothetical protein [uncultured Leifsonia sp.]|nr:hypothetical protein [uncultured Leifsonia sp.]